MDRTEIRLVGVGGQGIVLSGIILGLAASVYAGLNAVQTQAYGSSARGGDVRSELVISADRIIYPAVIEPDVMVAFSQKALNRFLAEMAEGGTLIIDSDLVSFPGSHSDLRVDSAPFTRIAHEEFRTGTVANMIMLGFLAGKTGILQFDAIGQALTEMVPPKTVDVNKKALARGLSLAAE